MFYIKLEKMQMSKTRKILPNYKNYKNIWGQHVKH